MLLDWAQILKGSGFLWMVPSAGMSWVGSPGRAWEGAGGTLSLWGAAREGWTGESVWLVLRWLDTLCWELF